MKKHFLLKKIVYLVANRFFAIPLMLISVTLLTINVVGLASSPAPLADRAMKPGAVAGYDYTLRSNTELYSLLETPVKAFDVDKVNNLIYESMLHSNARVINVQENWLLWVLGKLYTPLSKIQQPKRIVDGGGGLCSEVTAVFNEIAMKNNYETRFIDVNGHVVSEINTPDGWRVIDPDYGISYDYDKKTLESPAGRAIIARELAARKLPQNKVNDYISLFQSTEDNRTFGINQVLSPRLYMVETATEWLKWIIPSSTLYLSYLLMPSFRNTRISSNLTDKAASKYLDQK